VVALVAYLVPLLVGLFLLALRDVPALTRVYYRYHYLFDIAFTALASLATGAAAYLMLRSLLAPWTRLEAQLARLARGGGRLERVGEEHADRVVERINQLLALQRDFEELEELSKNAVAQEIHDGAVQNLVAARWALARGRLEEAEEAIASAEKALRRAIYELAPPELFHLSLAEAIRALGERMGLAVEVEAEPLAEHERVEVFRVVQHALENARRHGGARRVWVRVGGERTLKVEVEDDGQGLVLPVQEGQGLGILRARLRLLGGWLELTPSPKGGARLLAAWPREAEGRAHPGDRGPHPRA